jgi:DNA modification methylase
MDEAICWYGHGKTIAPSMSLFCMGGKKARESILTLEIGQNTSVWKIGRDAQSTYVHPTQKPVCLPEEAIMNSSKGSDCVVDLFGGSGSTLIACEKTGRVNRSDGT